MIVELDLVSQDSISAAFATIRREAGDPDVLIYNAGYLDGRDLPPDKELLEYIPVEMFDTAQHISSRGPLLIAKELLPAMRKKGQGSFFFSNNSSSLRGRQANDRTVLLLPQGHDVHAGASAHRGVLRARRARGERRDRRDDLEFGRCRLL
jgi:NAD(P)-dependent dehydrogenase (short-subunit alcohol dehydrogenase family)